MYVIKSENAQDNHFWYALEAFEIVSFKKPKPKQVLGYELLVFVTEAIFKIMRLAAEQQFAGKTLPMDECAKAVFLFHSNVPPLVFVA